MHKVSGKRIIQKSYSYLLARRSFNIVLYEKYPASGLSFCTDPAVDIWIKV